MKDLYKEEKIVSILREAESDTMVARGGRAAGTARRVRDERDKLARFCAARFGVPTHCSSRTGWLESLERRLYFQYHATHTGMFSCRDEFARRLFSARKSSGDVI
jgi:hypothetical protein